MTIEFIRLIFDYDKQIFNKMNAEIMALIFKQFAQSEEKGIIFTGCFDFGKGIGECITQMKEWTEGYDEVCVVELETSLEERLRRNKTENRLKHKASKRNIEWSENELLNSMKKHQYNSTQNQGETLFKNYIKIDNTNLSAKEAAKIIKERFNL